MSILLILFLSLLAWIIGINQIYGMMKGRGQSALAIPKEINSVGIKYFDYDSMIYGGKAWKKEVSFMSRLTISLLAISKFLIWPFGVDMDE